MNEESRKPTGAAPDGQAAEAKPEDGKSTRHTRSIRPPAHSPQWLIRMFHNPKRGCAAVLNHYRFSETKQTTCTCLRSLLPASSQRQSSAQAASLQQFVEQPFYPLLVIGGYVDRHAAVHADGTNVQYPGESGDGSLIQQRAVGDEGSCQPKCFGEREKVRQLGVKQWLTAREVHFSAAPARRRVCTANRLNDAPEMIRLNSGRTAFGKFSIAIPASKIAGSRQVDIDGFGEFPRTNKGRCVIHTRTSLSREIHNQRIFEDSRRLIFQTATRVHRNQIEAEFSQNRGCRC